MTSGVFNSKVTEVENKIPDIKNSASKTELTPIENKILDVSNSILKTEYATDISKIKNDYATTAALDARYSELVQKTHFNSELKKKMIKLVQTVPR